MATFATALKTGLFAYIISAATSYTIWQMTVSEIARVWWIPALILPPFLLVPLGRKCMMNKRPSNPTGVGWKLGFQWMVLFLIFDAVVTWVFDPSFTVAEDLLDPIVGIGFIVRHLVVLACGPIAAELYRKALRRRLGFFIR